MNTKDKVLTIGIIILLILNLCLISLVIGLKQDINYIKSDVGKMFYE
jgi:hypothetical protein